jgi:alpha-2-macroglobulin
MSQFTAVLSVFFNTILKSLVSLFGIIQWQQPQWLATLGLWLKSRVDVIRQKPILAGGVLLAIIAVGASSWWGYHWWQTRPKPVTVDFTVQAPERADLEQQESPHPLVVSFAGSVAPLTLVGKDVNEGISISPSVVGHWHWQDDKTLEFRPDKEWLVGENYAVKIDKKAIAPQILLARWQFEFAAPVFVATLEKSEFYQDPNDPSLKKAVMQLKFSHPVEPQSLEKNIELTLKNRAEDAKADKKLNVTVTYDKLKLNAFIHSESLPIPSYDQQAVLTVAAKITAAANANARNREPLTTTVQVPGLYNGLAINDVQLMVMPNKQTQQQEQILVIDTTMPVHEQKMAQAVEVWLLPRDNPKLPDADKTQPYSWTTEEVTPDILAMSSKLPTTEVPAEHEYSQTHGLRLQAEVERQLLVKINKDIKSFGGYQLAKPDFRTLTVPNYPKELHILGEGSLLTLSGEKKIALMARDLRGLKVELGRVLPNQVQHLISQGYTSEEKFGHPKFWSEFGQDNLSERFELKIPLEEQSAGTPNYQSVDLSSYMIDAQGSNKRGIFLLTAKSYDPDNADATSNPDDVDDDEEAKDKRLILVTDLGIVVKAEQDGSQVVFVQSINTGQPQAQAEVEVIAKNGLAVFSGRTDEQGKVRFAKLADLERERQPMLYLVKYQGDMSFLPIDRDDRKLNLSRFEINGEANAKDANQLNAYLFSDRGIYRPGETFHIGMIVKTAQWSLPLLGIPLQAEITDARGLTVKQSKINLEAGGFNELSYDTLDSSPTGNYTISLYTVKDGRSDEFLGSTEVKVEEFQPDRIKTTATFSKPVSAEGWVHPDDLKVTVNVQNLYGKPAEARKVEARMTLKPALPAFKRYKDYNFYDPHYAKEGFDEDLTAGQTDTNGDTVFALGLEKYTKATYHLRFFARAFEAEGGRSVAAEADTLVSDMPFLVGYKADGALNFVARSAKRHVQLLAINPQLESMTAENLTIELIERKVLSVLTRQEDNTYKYESRPKEISIRKEPLVIAKEGFDLVIDSNTAGDYSYLVRNAEGLLLSRIDYSVAGAGNVSRTLDRNAELQLTLDKPEYEAGGLIGVNIRAPYTGAGLITIERDKVYNSVWFKADTQASVQYIQVPQELTGNAYVNVQYIRDPSSDEIFMSPLSYGVAPFKISLARHTEPLKLMVPELIKPGETLSIKVSSPEPTRVVVFAVDEGILQVARYQNPDPLGHFFKKRQLAVDTTQILDLILPEFKKLMQAAAPGGDGEEDASSFLNPFKRKHDKPAVYWSGIVDLVGEKEFTYTVPETFNGTMRVMAVAVNDTKIASVSEKTQVRGELIVTPNAPYLIAPGDEFTVSVAVANHVKDSGDKANAQISLTVPSQLTIKDEAKKSVMITEGHEGVTTFKLQAATGSSVLLGNATLTFTAEVAGKTTTMRSELSVRPSAPKIAELRFGSFKGEHDVNIDRVLYPQHRKVSAGISPLPIVSVSGLIDYLDNFEHLCTEQLTSKSVPMLVLGKHPEFADKQTKHGSTDDFQKLLSVLRTRQNAEGGFGLWGASPEANDFASVYAIHVLMEAKAAGIVVPEDMLQKALGYLQTLAASPASELEMVRVRSYAAYLLTRQGIVTTTILSSLRENLRANFKETVWRNDLVAVYLAASYQLLQQQAVADDLINSPIKQLGATPDETYQYQYYYDSMIRDAQTVYVLAKHFPERLQALPPTVFQTIAKNLTEDRYNTLSSAYLLLAYSAYVDVVPPKLLQQMAIAAVDASGQSQNLALPNSFMPRVSFPDSTKKLHFSADSSIPMYYAVSESGYDQLSPTKDIKDGLEINRVYLNAKGEIVDKVALGEEITVQLRIRTIDRDYIDNLVVQDLLPAGFEAVLQNPAEQTTESSEGEGDDNQAWWKDRLRTGGKWTPQYADIREDRVVLYGYINKDLAEYQYKIKAISAGVFNVPPVYANAMYEPTLRARSRAGTVTVNDVEKPAAK